MLEVLALTDVVQLYSVLVPSSHCYQRYTLEKHTVYIAQI